MNWKATRQHPFHADESCYEPRAHLSNQPAPGLTSSYPEARSLSLAGNVSRSPSPVPRVEQGRTARAARSRPFHGLHIFIDRPTHQLPRICGGALGAGTVRGGREDSRPLHVNGTLPAHGCSGLRLVSVHTYMEGRVAAGNARGLSKQVRGPSMRRRSVGLLHVYT